MSKFQVGDYVKYVWNLFKLHPIYGTVTAIRAASSDKYQVALVISIDRDVSNPDYSSPGDEFSDFTRNFIHAARPVPAGEEMLAYYRAITADIE